MNETPRYEFTAAVRWKYPDSGPKAIHIFDTDLTLDQLRALLDLIPEQLEIQRAEAENLKV